MAHFGYTYLPGGGFTEGDPLIGNTEDAILYNGTSSEYQATADWRDVFANDGTIISLVTWIKPTTSIGGGSDNYGIFGLFEGTNDQDGIVLRIQSGGGLTESLVFGIGQAGSLDHRLHSTSFSVGTTQFVCLMICLEIGNNTGSAITHMYYNNNNASPALNPASASGNTVPAIGYPVIGSDNGGQFFPGCIGPIWMTNEEIDFSQASNRLKFTDASNNGTIKDLGADGSTPTGTQPKIYLKGNASNITQYGSLSLGSATITKAHLTDCATGITKS